MNHFTFKNRACIAVPEFTEICNTLTRKFLVAGKSNSCVENYLLQLFFHSLNSKHYKRYPLELTIEEIENYMVYLRKNSSPSLSSFKHLVCGLRHVFNIYSRNDLQVILPRIQHPKLLPVVFSKEEIKLLLKASPCIKHRVLLGTIYDCGLRISEVSRLLILNPQS